MQFTSTIILSLLLAVSTSTATAAQTSSNLRSGRKPHEETELNRIRDLGACNSPITIQSGDTCDTILNPCDGMTSLECVQAGKTCERKGSGLYLGDSCTRSNGCKINEVGYPDEKAPSNSFCGYPEAPGCPDGYTCCMAAGNAKHPAGSSGHFYCH